MSDDPAVQDTKDPRGAAPANRLVQPEDLRLTAPQVILAPDTSAEPV